MGSFHLALLRHPLSVSVYGGSARFRPVIRNPRLSCRSDTQDQLWRRKRVHNGTVFIEAVPKGTLL